MDGRAGTRARAGAKERSRDPAGCRRTGTYPTARSVPWKARRAVSLLAPARAGKGAGAEVETLRFAPPSACGGRLGGGRFQVGSSPIARFARAPIPAFPRKRGKGQKRGRLGGGVSGRFVPTARFARAPIPAFPRERGKGQKRGRLGGGVSGRFVPTARFARAPIPAFPRERGKGQKRGRLGRSFRSRRRSPSPFFRPAQ